LQIAESGEGRCGYKERTGHEFVWTL
jgi:hypothetical protein